MLVLAIHHKFVVAVVYQEVVAESLEVGREGFHKSPLEEGKEEGGVETKERRAEKEVLGGNHHIPLALLVVEAAETMATRHNCAFLVAIVKGRVVV